MTSTTTSAAGNTTINPTTTLPANLGPVIADAPTTTGTTDTLTTAPAPTIPTSAPTVTAPTTTGDAAGASASSGLKWGDTDKTLPPFKRVLQFIKGNVNCLNPKV